MSHNSRIATQGVGEGNNRILCGCSGIQRNNAPALRDWVDQNTIALPRPDEKSYWFNNRFRDTRSCRDHVE